MEIPNVHQYPTIILNCKNGADMNPSYVLGVISDKYSGFIVILGLDNSYKAKYADPSARTDFSVLVPILL